MCSVIFLSKILGIYKISRNFAVHSFFKKTNMILS